MIKSGLLNQKIKIVRFEDTSDGAGGTFPKEATYWETSGQVKEVKVRRDLMALQEVLKPTIEITVRYRTDKTVIPDMQLYWRGELFNIIRVEPDFIYKRELKIIAQSKENPQR